MKTLFLFLLLSIFSFPQSDSIDCDQLFYQTQHIIIEKPAEIIGGLDSIYGRIIFPEQALKNKIEGKVYILVLIDSTGKPFCPKVIKGLGYGCDEEAIRLVMSTNFFPAVTRLKFITTPMSIPIKFKLPD